MSREDLVEAYLQGQITRRIFVRRLVAAGVAITAATSYARMMNPAAARGANGSDDFYDDGKDAACEQEQNASQDQNQTQSGNTNSGNENNQGNQQSNQSIQQQQNCDTGTGGGGGGGGRGQTQQNNQSNQNGENEGIFGILNNIINQP